jgi:hypothetical protein
MVDDSKYRGKCFCGAVEIEATGQPVAMGYCHCESCRSWSAGPVNAFSLWAPDAVRVVKGEDKLSSYQKSETSIRHWCTSCGGHLFGTHPLWGVTDVFAPVLPDLPFKPALHVNYETTVLRMHDGLPKHKDFPAEMGGSGTLLPD